MRATRDNRADSELEGLVAVVTGAGHGVGAAHAKALASAGAKVVVNDLGVGFFSAEKPDNRAAAVANEICQAGGLAIHDDGDISDWRDAERLIEKTIREFGQLNILVCNAGIMRGGRVGELDERDFDAVQRVHIKGTLAPTHFAVQHWRREAEAGRPIHGRVISTGSSAAFYPSSADSSIAYATAKGAIHAFTLALAGELDDIGITVNCVIPTANVHTEKQPLLGAGSDRKLLPEQVSPLVVYLASKRGAHITGAIFCSGAGIVARIGEYEIAADAFKEGIWTVDELAVWFDRTLTDGYRAPIIDPLRAAQLQGRYW